MASSISISADVTVFGNKLHISPNPKFPTRIESENGFTLDTTQKKFTDNFPVPKEITAQALPKNITVSQIVVDTKTKEFQMGLEMEADNNFFLNKFPDVLTIDKMSVFVSCKQKP